jgi:hypothetical protein
MNLTPEKQIASKKYASKFKGVGGKNYKVPLITARHRNVFIKFIEEPNCTV